MTLGWVGEERRVNMDRFWFSDFVGKLSNKNYR